MTWAFREILNSREGDENQIKVFIARGSEITLYSEFEPVVFIEATDIIITPYPEPESLIDSQLLAAEMATINMERKEPPALEPFTFYNPWASSEKMKKNDK